MRRYVLRLTAVGYLVLVLLAPLAMVFWRAFSHGGGEVWSTLSDPNTVHAFQLTVEIAAIAVPLNTFFGIVCGLLIVRRRFPGAGFVNALVDLPLAISPVVVGLSLFLLYGRTGWFGNWFTNHGIQILFAFPSMVIATVFISLPFVCREVVPTLLRDQPPQRRVECFPPVVRQYRQVGARRRIEGDPIAHLLARRLHLFLRRARRDEATADHLEGGKGAPRPFRAGANAYDRNDTSRRARAMRRGRGVRSRVFMGHRRPAAASARRSPVAASRAAAAAYAVTVA